MKGRPAPMLAPGVFSFHARPVVAIFRGPDRGIDTSRSLGKSVYKSEAGSAVSFNSSLGLTTRMVC